MKGGNHVLDFLFPMPCVGCGLFVVAEKIFCPGWCITCETTRKKTGPFISQLSDAKIISAHSFDAPEVRRAIHALKYQYVKSLGKLLGQWMFHAARSDLHSKIILLPIPLTDARFALRGFNQAASLAHGIAHTAAAQGVDIFVDEAMLVRKKTRGQQAHKSREERLAAATNTFEAHTCNPSARYCIVDDVITTGSTMSGAILALQKAGAKNIYGVTVAAD